IISAHYDPMIAKLVVHARDRKAALSALASVLEETEIAGVAVNTAFLARLVQNSDFVAGKLNTRLIPRHQQALTSFPEPETRTMATAALAASGAKFAPDAPDPFDAISAYAHFHPITHRRAIRHGDRTRYYAITGLGDGRFAVRSEEENAETLVLPAEYGERIVPWPGHLTIFDGPDNHTFQLHDPLEQAGLAASGSESLRAPMPGLVKLVRVAPGDKVKKGQPLLVLEAMKMEHTVCAPHDGVIAETVAEGARVNDGTVLVRFAESNTPNAGRPARRNIEPSRL